VKMADELLGVLEDGMEESLCFCCSMCFGGSCAVIYNSFRLFGPQGWSGGKRASLRLRIGTVLVDTITDSDVVVALHLLLLLHLVVLERIRSGPLGGAHDVTLVDLWFRQLLRQ
jgi:hypothetical protein